MKPTVNDPLLPSRLYLLKVPQPSKPELPSIEHIHLQMVISHQGHNASMPWILPARHDNKCPQLRVYPRDLLVPERSTCEGCRGQQKRKPLLERGDVVFLALICLQSFQFKELSLAKFQGHTTNSPGSSRLLLSHSVPHCVTGIVLLTC